MKSRGQSLRASRHIEGGASELSSLPESRNGQLEPIDSNFISQIDKLKINTQQTRT